MDTLGNVKTVANWRHAQVEVRAENGDFVTYAPGDGTRGVAHRPSGLVIGVFTVLKALVLRVIVIDRLRWFQAGPFACRENALALTKIEEALHWLRYRTAERKARKFEGTNLLQYRIE